MRYQNEKRQSKKDCKTVPFEELLPPYRVEPEIWDKLTCYGISNKNVKLAQEFYEDMPIDEAAEWLAIMNVCEFQLDED